MMNRLTIAIALTAVLSASAWSQNNSSRIGDDYARAALRAIIYTNQSGIAAERNSFLINDADVEASTTAEEASLKEINRILGNWVSHSSYDHQPCYQALKANLKARNGATPEACK